MANYFWLPYYDETWNLFLLTRTGVRHQARILPYANGGHGYSGWTDGNWQDLANGDFLQIATHGRKYTTRSVAWVCPAGMISWTPEQMAYVIQGFVGPRSLNYELLACFGANGWGLASSFGALLATEMRRLQLQGSLTALQGATNIGVGQGRQTGQGRFTTGLKMLFNSGRTDAAGPRTADSRVSWNLYQP